MKNDRAMQRRPLGALYVDTQGKVFNTGGTNRYNSPPRSSHAISSPIFPVCPQPIFQHLPTYPQNHLSTTSYAMSPTGPSSVYSQSPASAVHATFPLTVDTAGAMDFTDNVTGFNDLSLDSSVPGVGIRPFPGVNPDEFLLIYDKGERLERVSKALLTAHSDFFAEEIGVGREAYAVRTALSFPHLHSHN